MNRSRSSSSRLTALAFASSLLACGTGPKLTNLRCRQAPCQDPEDPFKLRLAVDFDDSSGTLSQGALTLSLDGTTQQAVSLSDLFDAQNIPAGATLGTLQIDDDIALVSVSSGEAFTVSLSAKDGAGEQTNAPQLSLTLSLGSGN